MISPYVFAGTLKKKTISPQEIFDITIEVSGLREDQLKSRWRPQEVVVWRHSAMALCCQYADYNSLKEIGKIFGGKHHSSVINARDRVEEVLYSPIANKGLYDAYLKIKAGLDEIIIEEKTIRSERPLRKGAAI